MPIFHSCHPMRYTFAFFGVLFAFLSCGKTSRPVSIPVSETFLQQPANASLILADLFRSTHLDIVLPDNKTIKGKKVKLDKDSLLITFFPARLQKDYTETDTCKYVLWTCSSCNVSVWNSWLDEEYRISFPETGITETRCEKIVPFNENGKEYAAVFFDSHAPSYCEPSGARGLCCILGAAILQKVNNEWIVVGFNPKVGCYGSFGTTMVPDLYTDSISGENYFITNDHNSWNGGRWSIGYYHIFYIRNGVFLPGDILMYQDFLSGGNEWNSELKLVRDHDQSLVEITIKGYINKNKMSEFPPLDQLPPGLRDIYEKGKGELRFQLKNRYKINREGKARLVSSKKE